MDLRELEKEFYVPHPMDQYFGELIKVMEFPLVEGYRSIINWDLGVTALFKVVHEWRISPCFVKSTIFNEGFADFRRS